MGLKVFRLNLPQPSFLPDVIRRLRSQRSMIPTTVSATPSTFGGGLDRFEGINAAEWDEVPESQSSAGQQEITLTRRLEFSKIENEKVDDAANAVTPALPTRSCALAKESFRHVKRATCW